LWEVQLFGPLKQELIFCLTWKWKCELFKEV